MPSPSSRHLLHTRSAVALITAVLTACGGGSSTDSSPPPPSGAASVVLQGSAATGTAIASAPVDVKCASGAGSTKTGADGKFNVAIEGAALPCILRVTASTGEVFHSIADGSGAQAVVANITPLSELIVAQLAGGDASALFTTFDASAQARITSASIATQLDLLRKSVGSVVDLTGVDPLKDALVAATSGAQGNALDQSLDRLKSALDASQTTLAALGDAMSHNADVAAEVLKSLLQPVAANCPALHSGTYRWLDMRAAVSSETVSVDAAALTLTFPDGTVKTGTATAPCAFSADAGKTTFTVASSGVVIGRYLDSQSKGRLIVAFPEQALPVSEMTGDWNWISSETSTLDEQNFGTDAYMPNFTPFNGVMTVDASGAMTAETVCEHDPLRPCSETGAAYRGTYRIAVSGGGFTRAYPDRNPDQAYVYRTPGGKTIAVALLSYRAGINVATRKESLTLPAVGTVTPYWDAGITGAGEMSTNSTATTTVTSIDTAAQTYTRTRQDGRRDTLSINQPRDGFLSRAQSASQLANGTTVSVPSMLSLSLGGMAVYSYTADAGVDLGITVDAP
jgi:hypothetical protein